MANYLVNGDPMAPESGDMIVQTGVLKVGQRVPDGWRVLTGNSEYSTIARVVLRYEIEGDA